MNASTPTTLVRFGSGWEVVFAAEGGALYRQTKVAPTEPLLIGHELPVTDPHAVEHF
jgi:hypothetical protein